MSRRILKSATDTDTNVIQTVNGPVYTLDKVTGYSFQCVVVVGAPSVQTFDDDDVNVGADTVSEVAHGYPIGMKGALTTDGTLPVGLSATNYFVSVVDVDNYGFSTSIALAEAGTRVDITAAIDGGIHTATPTAHGPFDFVDGDVDTGPSNDVNETAHGFTTGVKVRLTTTGVVPAGLAVATDYWIIRVDDDNVSFASTLANAVGGTEIDITAAAGGGTHTVTQETPGSVQTFEDSEVNVGSDDIGETAHGYIDGLKLQLTTTGTLPVGLTAATDLFVIRTDADNYQLASSIANADAGTQIDITAAPGGGTHTFTPSSIAATVTHQSSNDNINFDDVATGDAITVNATFTYAVTDPMYKFARLQYAVTGGILTSCNNNVILKEG